MRWRCVALAVVVVGCTKTNPAAHCEDGSCSDPSYPFCDVSGAIAGEPGACIATACTADQFVECRGDVEVRCNADGTNYNLMPCDRGCDAAAGGCRLCDPGETACTNGQVATCDATGAVMDKETCPLGCFETEPRCREIDPSNGLASYFDMVPNPPDVELEDGAFYTNTGEVANNNVDDAYIVPNFLVPAPPGGVALRVFVVNNLKITKAMTAYGDGTNPALVVLARGEIRISGRLASGEGTGASLVACNVGNGLFRTSCGSSASGGGGGAFATNGAKGGAITNNSEPGGAAGIASGNERLVPLRGGCPGGDVDDASGGSTGAVRGSGGGAIQLVSRTKIVVDGVVAVHGGSGTSNDYFSGWVMSGGGSGGALLLEAPVVMLDVNANLDAAGGDGADICGLPTFADCSAKGLGAKPGVAATAGTDVACANVGKPTAAGSGGGGLGRIRINTADGTYTKASSAMENGVLTTGIIATR